LLIQNGTLLSGSVLFWDEPEANLNPRLMQTIVSILMELQRLGVQIFVSTHDYVFLKEFDLATKEGDNVLYHSLFRDKGTGEILHNSSETFAGLDPNAIDDTFGSIIDRQISKDMGRLGK
jgi:ABC-type arginine transport system ATPase subunit